MKLSPTISTAVEGASLDSPSGVRPDTRGCGLLTRYAVSAVPPAGAGLETDKLTDVPHATSPAVTSSSSAYGETTRVGRSTVFQRTTEFGRNSRPHTVIVRVESPTISEAGLTESSTGTGFEISSSSAFETALSGFSTVTLIVRDDARSAAGSCARNSLTFTNVVAYSRLSKRIRESATNPRPVATTVYPPPPLGIVEGVSLSSRGPDSPGPVASPQAMRPHTRTTRAMRLTAGPDRSGRSRARRPPDMRIHRSPTAPTDEATRSSTAG